MADDATNTARKGAPRISGARQHKLLESAERLIGIYGLEGVSLRQICAEAGYRNHYSVQHHFGDKLALADAILAWRTPRVEAARAAALQRLEGQAASPSLSQLFGELMLPILAFVDADGDRTYARLLLRLSYLGHGPHQPRWRHPSEVTAQLRGMILARLPHLPEELFRTRLAQVSIMFLDMVVNEDLARRAQIEMPPRKLVIEDTLQIAAAALSANITPAVGAYYGAVARKAPPPAAGPEIPAEPASCPET